VNRRARVLLADDDPALRAVIAEALGADGFDVLQAGDGAELLDLVGPSLLGTRQGSPAELVVADLRMPGLTGLSVLAGLRQLDCRVPFILITGYGDPATHAEAYRLGASAVLDKPFELRQLREAVRSCLAAGRPPGPTHD
jgi:CheY-like chemotaxis protein